MKTISFSVIVPVYRGKRYLDNLICMTKRNFFLFHSKKACEVELLFVNDCPDEPLTVSETGERNFQIRVLNLKENRGIHGAKLSGLEEAKGEFLLFLDQDDKIEDHFLYSQWRAIGGADVCVCNGMLLDDFGDERRLIYASAKEQEQAFLPESYMEGNRIVSMGQALVRASAIPLIWRRCQMRVNGADDYLFWILMLHCERRFVGNQAVLYYHIRHRHNTSGDDEGLIRSQIEMLGILKDVPNFSGYDKLERYIRGLTPHTALEKKHWELFLLMNRWLAKKQRGESICDYFQKRQIRFVAIYGMGLVGERLLDELKNSPVLVRYGIDRAAGKCVEEIPVYQPQAQLDEVDAIVVTAVGDFESIRGFLEKKTLIPVISLADVIDGRDYE